MYLYMYTIKSKQTIIFKNQKFKKNWAGITATKSKETIKENILT